MVNVLINVILSLLGMGNGPLVLLHAGNNIRDHGAKALEYMLTQTFYTDVLVSAYMDGNLGREREHTELLKEAHLSRCWLVMEKHTE